jgi:hypothetical protein
VVLQRQPNNNVTGFARVNVTLLLLPVAIPTPSVPSQGGTGGTSPPPPPPGPAPVPVPGLFTAGLDDSQPPSANGEIRTWVIDITFHGHVYRDDKGREHVQGEFINRFSIYNPGGGPVEGLEPVFRGEFQA